MICEPKCRQSCFKLLPESLPILKNPTASKRQPFRMQFESDVLLLLLSSGIRICLHCLENSDPDLDLFVSNGPIFFEVSKQSLLFVYKLVKSGYVNRGKELIHRPARDLTPDCFGPP